LGRIINGYIMPHPPVMVPEIGRNRTGPIEQSIRSANAIADQIAADRPDTIILSSPHAPCFRDTFCLAGPKVLSGSFSGFGHPEIKISIENNLLLAESIIQHAAREGFTVGFFGADRSEIRKDSQQLDHGALVPLYFVAARLPRVRLVLLSTPLMPLSELFRFGKCISQAVDSSPDRVVYLASGDLSHGLTEDAPAGFIPFGSKYDRNLIRTIAACDIQKLLATTEEEMELAAECGTRSFAMMFGALARYTVKCEVYSYEGPFGVGYLTAKAGIEQSPQVRLAKEAIDEMIKNHRVLSVPEWLPADLLKTKAGCFVSVKKQGRLRGCIGTVAAARPDLAEEIIHNAIHAVTEDPRFPRVEASELTDLEISVDVLGEPERVNSIDDLDVKRYGVIVSSGWRRGLLLPDLDGVDNPQEQVAIALRKAGIGSKEAYGLERFEVIRYY
jgi:AmmeMemoRadiSam system protein A